MSFREKETKRQKKLLISQFAFRCKILVGERVSERKKLRQRKNQVLLISQFIFRCKILVEERVSERKKLREKKIWFHNSHFAAGFLLRKKFQKERN